MLARRFIEYGLLISARTRGPGLQGTQTEHGEGRCDTAQPFRCMAQLFVGTISNLLALIDSINKAVCWDSGDVQFVPAFPDYYVAQSCF